MAPSSSPSTITRSFGSVPLQRTRMRPLSPSSFSMRPVAESVPFIASSGIRWLNVA
jgi:hypothetical protein